MDSTPKVPTVDPPYVRCGTYQSAIGSSQLPKWLHGQPKALLDETSQMAVLDEWDTVENIVRAQGLELEKRNSSYLIIFRRCIS